MRSEIIYKTLKSYFGYDTFRPMQEEIIQHTITGGDSLKIQSVAHRDNFSNAMDFIHKLQSIINKLKVKNSDCILFDKSSCYLTF